MVSISKSNKGIYAISNQYQSYQLCVENVNYRIIDV